MLEDLSIFTVPLNAKLTVHESRKLLIDFTLKVTQLNEL